MTTTCSCCGDQFEAQRRGAQIEKRCPECLAVWRRSRCENGQKSARCVVYAQVSESEHAAIKSYSAKEGLSLSDFVRRCINAWLCEQDDEVLLLTESGLTRA